MYLLIIIMLLLLASTHFASTSTGFSVIVLVGGAIGTVHG